MLYVIRPSRTRPGKTDKLPVHPLTGQVSDAQDSSIQLSAPDAQAALSGGIAHGIGFVFTKTDPFFFLDIDNAIVEGAWSATAQRLCAEFAGAFVEVSHSGHGLHIIGTTPAIEHGTRNASYGLELYTHSRFVALTGIHASGDPAYSADIRPLLSWPGWSGGGERVASAEWTTTPCVEWSGPLTDEELIQRMLSSRPSVGSVLGGRATVVDLWTANAEALGRAYPDSRPEGYDASSADAALCSHLAFWTGKDCERMDRLMRMSALYREKWEERQDYRERTIFHAVGHCQHVYGEGRTVESEPQAANPVTGMRDGLQMLSVSAQVQHFKGCVYVRSEDAIFVPDGALLKPGQFKATFGGFQFSLDVINEKTTKSAWEAFTESQGYNFPKAHEMCFRPELPSGLVIEEEGLSLLNTYVPILTPRQTGDPSRWINHIKRMLPCQRDHDILLAYMAALIQYPGRKFYWCPLIQGCQGNGKSLLISSLAFAIGKRYTHLPNPEDISNVFNAWIIGKLFIGIEEAYVADRQEMISVLKILVGNERVDIQGKGVNQQTGDNRANFMMTTNHKDAIRFSDGDRRFAIFFTAQQERSDLTRDGMDSDYFPSLYNWLRLENGYAIVNEYLHNYPIPDELNPATYCHRAPATSSTPEALRVSLGTIEQEVQEAIDEGQPGFSGGWVSSLALDKLLEDKRLANRVPRNRRRDLMKSLGYDYHPGLKDGRVNNQMVEAGKSGKPKLYLRCGHVAGYLTVAAEIVRAYQEAQQGAASIASAVFQGD